MSIRDKLFGVKGNVYSEVKDVVDEYVLNAYLNISESDIEGIPAEHLKLKRGLLDYNIGKLGTYLKSTSNWDEAINKIAEFRDLKQRIVKYRNEQNNEDMGVPPSLDKALNHIIYKSPDTKDVATILENKYRGTEDAGALNLLFKVHMDDNTSIGSHLKRMKSIDEATEFLEKVEVEPHLYEAVILDNGEFQKVNADSNLYETIKGFKEHLKSNKADLETELKPVETAKPKYSVAKYVGAAAALIGVGIIAYEAATDLQEYMKINNHLLPDAISAKAAAQSVVDSAQTRLNIFTSYIDNLNIVVKGDNIWKGVKNLVNTLSHLNLPVPDLATYDLVDKVAHASDKLTQGDFASQFPQNAYPDGAFLESIKGNPHLIHPGETLNFSPITNQAAEFLRNTLDTAKSAYDSAAGHVSALSAKASHLKDNMVYRGIGGAVAAIAGGAAYLLSKVMGGNGYSAPQTPSNGGPDGSGKETELTDKVEAVAETPDANTRSKEPANVVPIAYHNKSLESRTDGPTTDSVPGNVFYLDAFRKSKSNTTSDHTGISGMYQSYLTDLGRRTTKTTERVEGRLEKYAPLLENPSFSVKYAANELGVSASTVRRDLKLLDTLNNNYKQLELKIMTA